MKNKEVYEWYCRLEDKSTNNVCRKLVEKFDLTYQCSSKSLFNKLKRVSDKVAELSRNKKNDQKRRFLDLEFNVPIQETPEQRAANAASSEREKQLVGEVHSLRKEKKVLKRKICNLEEDVEESEFVSRSYLTDLNELEVINKKLKRLIISSDKETNNVKKELVTLQKQYTDCEAKLTSTEIKMQRVRSKYSAEKIASLNKKIQYRDNILLSRNEEIKELRNEVQELGDESLHLYDYVYKLSNKIDRCESRVEDLKADKTDLQKKAHYLKEKVKHMKHLTAENKVMEYEELRAEVEILDKKVSSLEEENRDMEALIELLDDDEIVSFKDGRYSNEVREVIMELLSLNVSMAKVNQVIKVVLNKLAKKDIGRLPSAGVKCRIEREALILGRMQVAQAMLERDGAPVNCLHGDGTSKYSKHYQNFQVTTGSGKTLSFGLAEIVGGDAASTLQCFTETIDELCDVITDSDKDETFAKLITSIKNTMSDLGPVNPLFNKLLKSLREGFLPNVVNRWSELTDTQKKELSEMGNFFCKLHLLANFATETDKVLNSFEKSLLAEDFETVFAFNTKEAGATRLVRTACKAFHVRGSDEAGVASHFNSFLAGKSQNSFFESFIGNRFNILFYNAAALYFHSDSIKNFLKSWPNPNNLLRAVLEDISNDLFLAECRALGIVDKIITGPLWRVIEKTKSILEMNPVLFKLKMKLSDFCKDASPVMSGSHVFDEFGGEVHDNEVYQKLFEQTNEEFDIMTQQALEVIFHALLIILERQCTEQLPGGKYWCPEDSIVSSSKNVPTTNKASESDFAILDLLIRTKPNASIQTIQALTMWSRNKTLDWLTELNDKDRDKLMDSARGQVVKMKEKYDDRKKDLHQQKKERLAKKQQEKIQSEEKSMAKKAAAVNSLIENGVRAWLSAEEAEENLKFIDIDMKKKVLYAQLEFYRYVMGVKCSAKLFNKTKCENNKRVELTSNELFHNLKSVITVHKIPQSETKLIGKQVVKSRADQEKIVSDSKKDLMQALQQSRLSQLQKQQRLNLLPQFLAHPENIVGKVIQHKVKEEASEEVYWSKGKVVSVSLNQKNPKRSLFDLVYDDEPNNVWSFPLLVDFEKGDVIILS